MSENKQPCNICEHNPEYNPKQNTDRPIAILTDSGIGGGLAGAAIGGLLGHRVGGVFGAVVGATAGGLVGNGTAVRVNRVVESIENSASSVSDTVNHNVNSIGTALKDTIEEVKPFVGTANTVAEGVTYGIKNVNSVVDTLRDTVNEVKPSVVGTAYTVAQGISYSVNSVNSIVNTLKDTVDRVKPSVVNAVDTVVNTVKDTIEEIKPSANSDEEITEDQDLLVPALTTPAHPEFEIQSVNTVKDSIEEKPSANSDREIVEDADIWVNLWEDNSELDQAPVIDLITQAHPEFEIQTVNTVKDGIEEKPSTNSNLIEDTDNSQLDQAPVIDLITQAHPEFEIQSSPEVETNPRSQRIEFIKGISPIIGAVIGAVAFVSLGSISGFSPIQNSKLRIARSRTAPLSDQSPSTPADGWVFIGNVNKTSPTSGKALVEGSQSTDSSVVPSVGALVTVSFEPGVTLRDNVPQKPNFSYKEQKALDVVKPTEKLKILQVEFITPPQATKSITSVWAKVDRCDADCN